MVCKMSLENPSRVPQSLAELESDLREAAASIRGRVARASATSQHIMRSEAAAYERVARVVSRMIDPPDIRPGPCPACDGAGEWDEGPLPASSGASEPEYRQVICSHCEGEGRALIEVEPATIDDTLGVLVPEDGKHPHFWPFEPATGEKP